MKKMRALNTTIRSLSMETAYLNFVQASKEVEIKKENKEKEYLFDQLKSLIKDKEIVLQTESKKEI